MNGSVRAWFCAVLMAACGVSALRAGDDPAQQDPLVPAGVQKTIRGLRRAALSPPSAAGAGADLKRAVEHIRAMRLRQKGSGEPATAPRPAATQPSSAPAGAPSGQAGKTELLTPELLKQMMRLPPAEVVDPVALADALFLIGRLQVAFRFYGLALKTEKVPEERAWLLYQMGNCRRQHDAAEARKIYQRLVAEHPGCPWNPLATVQDHLAEWYVVNKPRALIAATDAGAKGR